MELQPQIEKEGKFKHDYRFLFKESKKWKEYLKQNGFVVIANWLSESQCQAYVGNAWNVMEKLAQGRLDRNDKKTQILGKNYPFVLHGGMIQYVGHSQIQWDLRKSCKPIFQQIWGTEELKTSFDGFCFMNGMRNYKKRQGNAFLHCDQAPNKNFLWSYQGVMTLTTAEQDDGGFVVVPKSNQYHHQYFAKKKMLANTENWYLVPDNDKVKQPFCMYEKINTQAGDFILFDSRTFHCNTVPTTQVLRICTYICMLPTSKIPESILKKRRKAYEDKRTSSHHAGDGFKLFSKLPNMFKAEKHIKAEFQGLVDEINKPVLDEVMIGLI